MNEMNDNGGGPQRLDSLMVVLSYKPEE